MEWLPWLKYQHFIIRMNWLNTKWIECERVVRDAGGIIKISITTTTTTTKTTTTTTNDGFDDNKLIGSGSNDKIYDAK